MRFRLPLAILGIAASAAFASPAAAQQTADIVRGRVTGPDSLPIPNVSVLVTSFMGGISKNAKTDRNGRFSVMFPNGEGDYMVRLTSIGYEPKAFEIKRIADEEVLIADTRLARAVQRLDTVNITTSARRQTPTRVESTIDASGTDRSVGLGTGAAAGNLAAIAAGLPGFQFIPGVDGNPDMFSALGLTGDQNNQSLNGMSGSGGDLPRDANVGVSVGTGPFDVSRNGFSGAQVAVNTRSGTNYSARSMSGNLEVPPLQWTDRVGQSTASEYTLLSPGAGFSGALSRDKAWYSGSVQYSRNTSDFQNLFNTNANGLTTFGVAPDSAQRLRTILQNLNIPIAAGGFGDGRSSDNLRLQGNLDFSPPSSSTGNSYQIAAITNVTRQAPLGGGQMLSSVPTVTGDANRFSGQVMARHTNYFWTTLLSQTWVSASIDNSSRDPFLDFPMGNVRVSSDLGERATVQNLQFGGNSSITNRSTTGMLGAKNQLSWYAGNNKHSIKLITEVREDWYSNESPGNRLGSFTFQSLEDLENGLASAYSRVLTRPDEKGRQLSGSVGIQDAWRPSPTVQVVYNALVNGNYFHTQPDENPLVESAFGVKNTYVPNRMYVSPRVGFSWQYGQPNVIPIADGFTIGPRAVVRGGIGLYQNVAGANLLGGALTNTGLAGSTQTLTCVGAEAPTPDWDAYRLDPSSVPSTCASGNTVFASSLPSVTMFDKSYKQASAARANVNWYGGILDNRFTLTADATVSLGLNQSGQTDLNFNPATQFTLDNESDRPVFVAPTSISPASGGIAPQSGRVSPDFNRVMSRSSNLRNTATQLTLYLAPYTPGGTGRFRWNANYTWMETRDKYNGFGGVGGLGSTSGNPLDLAWGRASSPTHRIGYGVSYNFWDVVSVGYSGGFRSGVRYTPMVDRDINGDGASFNDRAFVYNPSSTSDATIASGIQSLLDRSSQRVRDCVYSQMGGIAARNSCEGPWTMDGGSLTFNFNPTKVWMPPRTNFTLTVRNPLVALDMMLHGSKGLRGWGQTPNPNSTLLNVRGFDPGTQRFRYEVNQRFGSTDMSQTTSRAPVIVTAAFSVNVAPTRDWQSMRIGLDRGRSGRTGTKLTESQLRGMSSALGVVNPMATILRQPETMRLTRQQADSLAMLSRTFTIKLDSIWLPVAKYLAEMPDAYNLGAAHNRFVVAREAAVDYLATIAPHLKNLLTAQQRRKLPITISRYFEPLYLAQMRAGLAGGGLPIEAMMMIR
ncbi:MAG TPA: carboxypeptidase-like regulatory domain-containing protein [Gemmatimonadaceae bacterium]|nr:carboxypeptidase-like regulatory domain-containing protein [Gemmatimonadaceae bacterium]